MTEDVDGPGSKPGPERGKWAAPRQRQGARGKPEHAPPYPDGES